MIMFYHIVDRNMAMKKLLSVSADLQCECHPPVLGASLLSEYIGLVL